MALDIERWLKWVEEKGFEMVGPSGSCDVCQKGGRGNHWMVETQFKRDLIPTVCEAHAREYGLIW